MIPAAHRLRPERRIALLASALALVIGAACSQPASSRMVPGHLMLTFNALPGSGSLRVVLTRIAGDTAVDTTVAIPSGASSITVDLNVSIDRAFYSTGEPMSITLKYLNAAGQTLLSTSPTTVTVKAR